MEPKKHIEQFEVIEHHVTTGRRPITSSGKMKMQFIKAVNYIPSTEVRRSSETFLTSGPEADRVFRDEAERRYQLTGERDASRDASFGLAATSPLREQPILQSTPERSYSTSGINNYGYDVHEVHTTQGGAQIVNTYGAGDVFETSIRPILNPILNASTSPSSHHATFEMPQSILKNAGDRFHDSDNSLSRKDSYKRMQETQVDNASVYAPSSQATMISRPSKGGQTKFSRVKRDIDCCKSLVSLYNNMAEQFRDTEKTPALLCNLCLILLFLLMLLILLIIFLRAAFSPYSVSSFLMFPPVCQECLRKNPAAATYRDPSRMYVHIKSPSEIDFEMVGNHPLKSNSYTLVDFTTGYVAIADHALTDNHGRHYNCFLMKLDREALPDMDTVLDAVAKTSHEVHQDTGWQEHWQYVVKPIATSEATSKFHSTVKDCLNAKWYQLEHAVYTRDESCSSCYDFCFPDYAIQRRQKYEDDISLNVRRLNCFRHHVPEWVSYSIESDENGGHSNYPRRPFDTQRDEYNEWTSWGGQTSWNSWSPVHVVGRPDNDLINVRDRFNPLDHINN
ncbi:hypothetical protein M3Y97_00814300 [Aphelenchoides bicaudatus]|nr:hypothetical protein M3Y97_00814300 [Aphelenchoides bicaudatus]